MLRWMLNMLLDMLLDMWDVTVADAWGGLRRELEGLFKAPPVNDYSGQDDDRTPP